MKELTQLQYFQVLAKYQHVTKAAEALHISQPNLSNSLSRLEKDLGVQLFDHRHGKITLNEYGKTYLEYVNRAFSILDEGKERLSEMKGVSNLQVTIGCSFVYLMEPMIMKYEERLSGRPFNLNISYSLSRPADIEMALLNGKIDFACTQKIINPAIEWVPVMNSGLSAAVSLQNPLSARKSLHWEDLAGEQFICDRVGIDREFLEGVCKNHGFKPTVAIECGEGRLVGVLLENNRGVGVIPDHDLPGLIANFENTPRNAVNIPIVDDDAVVTVGLARLRDRDMSHAAKELYDFLIEYLHDMKSRSQEAVEQLWGEK